MDKVINLNGKRVCDVSADGTYLEIRQLNCLTKIEIRPDGTFAITHEFTTLDLVRDKLRKTQ